IRHLRSEMALHAEHMEFEKAQQIKEKLALFEDYQARSTVLSQFERDLDVFSIAADDEFAYVNYLQVVQGAIINSYTQELKKNLNQDEDELLAFAIDRIRERYGSLTREVIVPMEVQLIEPGITMTIPQRGE